MLNLDDFVSWTDGVTKEDTNTTQSPAASVPWLRFIHDRFWSMLTAMMKTIKTTLGLSLTRVQRTLSWD